MAKVIAVSAHGVHAFSKPNRTSIRLIAGFGVDGDAHSGITAKHRSRVKRDPAAPNLRQLHLLQDELIEELNGAGFSVSPGMLGENITTRGLNLLALPCGTHLHLGTTAVAKVMGLRNPCQQLNELQPGLMQAVLDYDADGGLIRKAGIMAIILVSGDVRPGDRIRIELPPPPYAALEPV